MTGFSIEIIQFLVCRNEGIWHVTGNTKLSSSFCAYIPSFDAISLHAAWGVLFDTLMHPLSSNIKFLENGGRPWTVYHNVLFQWLMSQVFQVRHNQRCTRMYLPEPNYLTLSRHGIYYLRIPIPIAFHPEVKASDIKLSLRTKNKQLALCLSTMLRLVVDNAFEESGVIAMDYKSIRQHVSTHFRNRLSVFRDAVLTDGPIGADRKAALEAVIEAAKGNREKFINHSHLDDQQRLVSDFCEQEGITDDLSGQETDVLLSAYQAAYLQHAEAALAFNAAQSVFDLQDGPHGRIASPSGALGASSLPLSPSEALEPVGDSLSVLAERFLKEGQRGDLWVAKTVA